MRKRADIVWRVVLLVYGLPFHALIMLAIGRDVPELPWGLETRLTIFVMVILVHALMGVAGILRMRRRRRQGAHLLAAAAIVPVGVYLLTFDRHWPLALTGLAFAVTQANLVLRAPQTLPALAAGRLQAWRQNLLNPAWTDMLLLMAPVMLAAALVVSGHRLVWWWPGWLGATILAGLTLGIATAWEWSRYVERQRRLAPLEVMLLGVAAVALIVPAARVWVLPLLAARQMLLAGRIWLEESGGKAVWNYLVEHPGLLLAITFAGGIIAGAVLLGLPQASRNGETLPLLDALFTATSAICVTGLIVVDTGSYFSTTGQMVILALIQIGGLGIMTISTFVAIMLGRNIGLRGEMALREVVGEQRTRTALRLLKFIVIFTFGIELVGTLVLALLLRSTGMDFLTRIYHGMFHSVSAFCNAGFALYADSLVGFAQLPLVVLTISVLLILGGLGFGAIFSLEVWLRGRGAMPLHSRIVFLVTAVLAVGGTLLIWILERNGALAALGWGDSLLHAWFQSVTTRTAGFNSLDMSLLSPATQALMMVLMFIGGAPGSTAGGIKVTTFLVLVLVVRSVVRGDRHVVMANRQIGARTVSNAIALVGLALSGVAVACIVMLATQPQAPLALLFEVFSAFGTVGLSMNVTPGLTPVGKIVVIALMFVGRVGPLTVLMMMRPAAASAIEYPQANVMIG